MDVKPSQNIPELRHDALNYRLMGSSELKDKILGAQSCKSRIYTVFKVPLGFGAHCESLSGRIRTQNEAEVSSGM